MTVPESPGSRPARAPPTPGGLERIARGDLSRFDVEMFENLDTGVLEAYLDERNRRENEGPAGVHPRTVVVALVGAVLAAVTLAYVGVALGLLVGGVWFAMYLHGLSQRLRATSLATWAGAVAGAGALAGGLALVLPALHILAPGSASPFAGAITAVPSLAAIILVVGLAAALSALVASRARRELVVEYPVPYPGFAGTLRLLGMAEDASEAARRRTRHSLAIFAATLGVSALFTFLRDAPVRAGASAFASVIPARFFSTTAGFAIAPAATGLTWLNLALSPLFVGAGWLLRPRLAYGAAAGAAVTWLVIVPLAVALDAPVYFAGLGDMIGARSLGALGGVAAAPILAFTRVAAVIMAGSLAGAGVITLARSLPRAFRKQGRVSRPAPDSGIFGRYAWPRRAATFATLALLVVAPAGLALLGIHFGGALVLVIGLAVAVPFVGLAAWRAIGDARVEPISPAALLAFLVLALVVSGAGLDPATSLALGLVGAIAIAAALAFGGSVLLGLKAALYGGERPYAVVGAHLVILVPALVVGVYTANLVATAAAVDPLAYAAPQSTAFAVVADLVVGGHASVSLFLIGLVGGALVELLTGAGIAFSLGGFLLIGQGTMLAVGAFARSVWERREAKHADTKHLDAEKRVVRRLDVHVAAFGLIAGEALVAVAILAST